MMLEKNSVKMHSRLYEVTHARKFLTLAGKIFDWVWQNGWDTSVCGGGVWFDNSQGGKETIENVQMFQLGMKLARYKHGKYKSLAETVWKWIHKVHLINMTSYQVCLQILNLDNFNQFFIYISCMMEYH